MPKVCITGCAGFIGSNLTRSCLDAGWRVFGVDDMSSGHVEFLPEDFASSSGTFYESTFVDDNVFDIMKHQQFDVVVHLAAIPRVSYSVEHPVETHETNVDFTLEMLEFLRNKSKGTRVVFASSSSVYGGADTLPTPETTTKSPKSPYALQKSIIEDYLRLYYDLYGLDSVSLRFHNVFGPNQLGGSPYSTAVSAWLTAVKRGTSMRSDGSGEQFRDMCYVDNVVDAVMRATARLGHLKGDIVNVACGQSVKNNEIREFLLKRYPGSVYHVAPPRAGDVFGTLADIQKAQTVLGYTPKVLFWEGLEKTCNWYDENWEMIKEMK